MKVKILMTKVITISTRGSLAGRTTMCSQETRTRVQRTFAILVSAEIEGSVAIGSYYPVLLFPLLESFGRRIALFSAVHKEYDNRAVGDQYPNQVYKV